MIQDIARVKNENKGKKKKEEEKKLDYVTIRISQCTKFYPICSIYIYKLFHIHNIIWL